MASPFPNLSRLPTIVLVMAVVCMVLAQGVPAMQARHVCVQTLRACELSHMGEAPVEVAVVQGHSCCAKKQHHKPQHGEPERPGQVPPCSCCVTICSPSTCAMVAAQAAWVEEPSPFDSIIAPALPHACDWVGDLFRPPCI